LTAGHPKPRQDPQLHGYDGRLTPGLIDRARAAVPELPTPALVRIRELLEAALATDGDGGEEGRRALAELARALRGGA